MSSGVYNRLDLVGAVYTTAVANNAVSGSKISVVTVNFVNRLDNATQVRLALSSNPTAPANTDFLEFNTTLNPNGVLERTGIIVPAGLGISVYSTSNGVSVVAYGIESS